MLAIYVNLEKLLDKHIKNEILDQIFYDKVVERLRLALEKLGFPGMKMIPIITGFFGPVSYENRSILTAGSCTSR